VDQALEGVPDIAHEVKAVSHLHGLRDFLSASRSIGICPIADQYRDGGMDLQPLHESLGRASLEDGHRLMAFRVHQQGSIGRATAKRELVDPQNTRRGEDKGLGTLTPNEGVGAGPIPKQPGDAGGHLGATGMR
jgi:hypothetical protein